MTGRVGATLVVAILAGATAWGDEAHLRMPLALAAQVETGDRHGHVVSVELSQHGAVVVVSRSVQALPPSPRFPLPLVEDKPGLAYLEMPLDFAVPNGIVRGIGGERTAFGVVEQVVAWISQHIAVDDQDSGPQDAAAVLARRRGRCSGRANAAIGVLRALGLPARPVHGVLVGERGARWHRWGEVWLGPLGWVAFDPGASVGLVGVRYVPMRGASAEISLAGVRVLHLDERGYAALPRRGGLRVVPSGGATMTCRPPSGAGWVTALLLGPDGVRRAKGGEGVIEFRGLLPGRYRLAWEFQGRMEGAVEVVMSSRDVLVTLSAGGEGS